MGWEECAKVCISILIGPLGCFLRSSRAGAIHLASMSYGASSNALSLGRIDGRVRALIFLHNTAELIPVGAIWRFVGNLDAATR